MFALEFLSLTQISRLCDLHPSTYIDASLVYVRTSSFSLYISTNQIETIECEEYFLFSSLYFFDIYYPYGNGQEVPPMTVVIHRQYYITFPSCKHE